MSSGQQNAPDLLDALARALESTGLIEMRDTERARRVLDGFAEHLRRMGVSSVTLHWEAGEGLRGTGATHWLLSGDRPFAVTETAKVARTRSHGKPGIPATAEDGRDADG